MAALPEPPMGIDPETMDPMEMPVDPGMPPADPMLGPVDEGDDEYEVFGDHVEVEEREKVELCLLGAIEACAKAVEVGVGADNPDFAAKFGQAAQSLSLSYEALTRSELAAEAQQQPNPSDF